MYRMCRVCDRVCVYSVHDLQSIAWFSVSFDVSFASVCVGCHKCFVLSCLELVSSVLVQMLVFDAR